MTRDRLWPAVLTSWALASLVLCLALSPTIYFLRFPDPDDAMRLLEVRDWLAGQSWWDVSQHRLNDGMFFMHWSRLVDLPIVALLWPLTPFVGTPVADRIAMTIVPLLTLLTVMMLGARLTQRLAGTESAHMAGFVIPLSIPLLYQLRPMRIDHHGWQIALALAATTLLLGRPTLKNGLAAGLALAALVTISLEGLPIAVIIVAVAVLAWVVDVERRVFALATIWGFFGSATALHMATRGPEWAAPACDAMSPGWLATLAAAAVGLTIATHISAAKPAWRAALLVPCGIACLGVLTITAPACVQGPFAHLDPLVRTIWYDNVSEGLPIWRQTFAWGAISIALPVVGILGSVMALRRSHATERLGWWMLLAVLLPTFALSLLVWRVSGTANALAIPGAASLLLVMLQRTRRIGPLPTRTLATAGAFLVASPGLAIGGVQAMANATLSPGNDRLPGEHRPACQSLADIRPLFRLPPSIVFAAVDVTPDLIATTDHHAIAGGYHRNVGAIRTVLAAFTGTPQEARTLILASHAAYVAVCPGLGEPQAYTLAAPNGLWSRLERGERFDWLRPVPMTGSPVLVWRVIDPADTPLSAAPSAH